MKTFCTIITASHLPLAKVLHTSLQKHSPDCSLQVLVVDSNEAYSNNNLTTHSCNSIINTPYYKEIEKKYAFTKTDNFRWALKPVFISYLLATNFTKVIFVDCDVYFVGNHDFLFDELDQNNLLLTPHWANLDPLTNEDSLLAVLQGGLFNAGFVAVNISGLGIMTTWASLCCFRTEDRKALGLFVDQKYLDIFPVQFDNVKIIKHQGCNLASWNIDTCKREMINGKLYINKKFEPVFIHFAKDTIVNILNKNDALLKPFLKEYVNALKIENFDLLKDLDNSEFKTFAYSIKHKLRLRTRIKRFFFRLAENL